MNRSRLFAIIDLYNLSVGSFNLSGIYIAKTNEGVQASATVDNAYGTLTDKNYGIDGNKYYYNITQTKSEVAPTVSSSVITYTTLEEEGTISVSQAGMADGDYFFNTGKGGCLFSNCRGIGC